MVNSRVTIIKIYTDASFDPATKTAVGAYLFSGDFVGTAPSETLDKIFTTTFDSSSCGIAELLTTLKALQHFEDCMAHSAMPHPNKLTLFTDSKTTVGLPSRRQRLEASRFISKRSGTELSNRDLYQKFYLTLDRLAKSYEVSVEWVKGHTTESQRTPHEVILSRIDKAARSELRHLLNQQVQ